MFSDEEPHAERHSQ